MQGKRPKTNIKEVFVGPSTQPYGGLGSALLPRRLVSCVSHLFRLRRAFGAPGKTPERSLETSMLHILGELIPLFLLRIESARLYAQSCYTIISGVATASKFFTCTLLPLSGALPGESAQEPPKLRLPSPFGHTRTLRLQAEPDSCLKQPDSKSLLPRIIPHRQGLCLPNRSGQPTAEAAILCHAVADTHFSSAPTRMDSFKVRLYRLADNRMQQLREQGAVAILRMCQSDTYRLTTSMRRMRKVKDWTVKASSRRLAFLHWIASCTA
ncbi:hypothetical protein CCMA1212_003215 [Trichoderma ghanense]|uniref:Uncharacterized protein n=1 Tax=Trichoderma ghanense TaxID=65468 RepID=A0ABY2HB30_9HYPO